MQKLIAYAHRTLYLVSTSQTVTDEILLCIKFSGDARELETKLLVITLNLFVKVLSSGCIQVLRLLT